MQKLKNNLYYVGVNDHKVDLFEGQYIVPNGMAYNSYIIKDELIAVMDTVEINFYDEWMKNIKEVLGSNHSESKPVFAENVNSSIDFHVFFFFGFNHWLKLFANAW